MVTQDQDLQLCFPAFLALRPHLPSLTAFMEQVHRQALQGYQIVALKIDGRIPCVAGFRINEFLAWGRILYIDDLSTVHEARQHGHANMLIDWLIAHGTAQNCTALHLDTGYTRFDAHRLYLRKGFQLSSHHMTLQLPLNQYGRVSSIS
ncbi:MAG: GNAT family N-acetyltransferase [Burkholderiales bacterium]|nr:GNAT family N-acetyltransferase [Burkholderiales bacterium]